tara:strand:- start:3622 stop:4416 length:795 start_codon:yes stop_codon:yes gene_type:complete
MPAYNVEQYIMSAVKSVLNQSYENWELLLINDGSIDRTNEEIKKINDSRIKIFYQENGGVSKARNLGLRKMQGEYFCFFDADDYMPMNSISARLSIFQKKQYLSFVDGCVIYRNKDMMEILKLYHPCFTGQPFKELIKLSSKCFFGNTWMIKRKKNYVYKFNEKLKYLEDIYFYLSLPNNGYYDYTEEAVLYYRTNSGSAMSNINHLEEGYSMFYNLVKNNHRFDFMTLAYLKCKITKIMFLTYFMNNKSSLDAFKFLLRFLRM